MTAARSAEHENAPSERHEALRDGTTLLGDQFTITSKLGKGGFGITYMANDNYLNRNVVIKECFPEVFCHRDGKSVIVRSTVNAEKYRSIVDMFMREARSLAKLRHPNIIGVHRVFEENDTAYMALDLIEGRDLQEIIEHDPDALTPTQIKSTLTKLLDAIDVIHQEDLLHRDISPDNILLDKWGNPVLIDFGAAREEASRETRALSAVLVVKDGYSPQEFYFSGGKQTACSDLYALGATFYHLISGTVPPNSQTRMAEVAGGSDDPCEPLAGRFPAYEPAFLAAIDQAMRVLPKERLQSVQEWAEVIDSKRKVATPMTKAMGEKLNKQITRLVSETNDYVLNSQPRENKPKAEPVVQPKVKIPDWVKEFNQETKVTAQVKKTEASAVVERPETQFAERPEVEKQPTETRLGVRKALHDELLNQHPTAENETEINPPGFRLKLWRKMNKIRVSWMAVLLAIYVVQTEQDTVTVLAQTLMQ